jgi:hypothetical protein
MSCPNCQPLTPAAKLAADIRKNDMALRKLIGRAARAGQGKGATPPTAHERAVSDIVTLHINELLAHGGFLLALATELEQVTA